MWRQIKWIYAYAHRYLLHMFFYTMLGLTGTIVGLLSSLLSRDLVDIITGHSTGKLIQTFASMILLTIGTTVLNQISGFASNYISMKVDAEIKADVFAEGDSVDITGISKGKGYAGVIKRFGAHRSPMSHGAGPMHRHQGSMGSCSDPSRVFKGKMMPGHMGNVQVTVQNLDVVKVDPEMNMIAVRGAVPGPKGGIVFLKNTVKNA